MPYDVLVDSSKPFGVSDPGFAFDIRPGLNPNDWFFDGLYAWPVPHGLSPITLKPTPIDSTWETTAYDGTQATEHYRRYTKDDFNVLIGSNLIQYPGSNPTDWNLLTREAHTSITGKEFLESGEGLYIEFCASGRPGTNKKIMEVQFGDPSPGSAFWLTIYENGRGYLSTGPIDFSNPTNQLADGILVPNSWGSIINKWIKLFILSHGRNRLLISSSTGNSFIYEDTSVSRSGTNASSAGGGFTPLSALPGSNTSILDTTGGLMKPGYYRIDTFTKSVIKPRPIPHFITGSATPKVLQLYSVPGYPSSGPPLTDGNIKRKDTYDIFGIDTHFTGAVQTTFHPTRIKEETTSVKPTVTLKRKDVSHKDVNKSPQFYRSEASIDPVVSVKDDHSTSIFPDIIQMSHNTSESGLTGKIKLRFAENHSDYAKGFGLPFQIEEDGNIWLKSFLISPSYEDKGQPFFQNGNFVNRQQYLSWSMIGFEKYLKESIVQSITRLDNLGIDDAVKQVLIAIGFPSDGSMWDIDTSIAVSNGEKIGKTSIGEADSNPTNLTDVAKSAEDWIKYLIETYTSAANYPFHWVAGFRPYLNANSGFYEWRFFFKNPDLFSDIPIAVFYPDEQIAIAQGETDYANAYKHVHFNMFTPDRIEQECNHLYLFGIAQTVTQTSNNNNDSNFNADVNNDATIAVELKNKNSIDATIPLDSRGIDWLGWDKKVVIIDGALNTKELVNMSAKKIFDRISKPRMTTSIEAEWNPLIRIWDKICTWSWKHNIPYSGNYASMIAHPNNFDIYNDWRVIGIDVEHIQDSSDKPGLLKHRKARYHLERQLK